MWLRPSGRAVLVYGDVARAGWIAWRAIMLGVRGPGGPEGQKSLLLARAVLRARDLGSNVFGSLLLLADNFIHHLRTKPQRHEGTKTHKEIQDVSPALRFLRATASSAGQPQGRAFAPFVSRLLIVAAASDPGRQGSCCPLSDWPACARESGRTIAHIFLMGRN
ncbi:MAG: hypothetical protein PHW87_13325 [Methanothrix sp.]|nr:hypothetical protein [Methanothrix sp.]